MKDPKNHYKKIKNIEAYDNKYFYGKSVFDNKFDNNFVQIFSRSCSPSNKILEIGSYTGRISKMLERNNIFFDQSDIHDYPIYTGPNSKNYIKIRLDSSYKSIDFKYVYNNIIS